MNLLFDIPTPVMAVFDPTRCEVAEVNYATARLVVAEAHYLGRLGATSTALGVYADGVIGGVMTFGTIPRNNAEAICGPSFAAEVMELTRLALYDWLPRNAESWFIGRALAWLSTNRPDLTVLVSYADSNVGHVGTIYQATNWIYTGASTNDMVYACDTGEVWHPRTTGRRKATLPPGRWQAVSAKHRYVNFIGPRRRTARRALRWEPLAYPKRDGPVTFTSHEAAS